MIAYCTPVAQEENVGTWIWSPVHRVIEASNWRREWQREEG